MAIALRTAILIFGLVTLMAGACRSARAEDPEFLTAPAPSELDAAVREKILTVHVGGSPGADLVVTAFAPQGRGPFPLVVFNHGKNPIPPEQHKRYRAIYAAHYFVSRGYAVLVPMMRGFAGSSGTTYAKGCDPVGMAEKHAHDIADVISQAAGLDIGATIDASRIVVAGQSMGGWDSLAVAALNPPGVKGVIDFSGGYKAPSCPDWEGHLVEGAGKFGRNAREPALWFYGDNDSYFPVALWRRMKEAYAGAGGSVDLDDYGRFMDNSHYLVSFVEGVPIWTPRVDAFLGRLDLPHAPLHPELLPGPFPTPTGYAAIDDVGAPPGLSAKGRQAYRDFLALKPPRVFMITPTGGFAWASGGFDPMQRAKAFCVDHKFICTAYAVDNDVVWPSDRPAPMVRHDNAAPTAERFESVSEIPYVDDGGREAYRKFLAANGRRAFVVAPDGGWSWRFGGADPLNEALASCGAKHNHCAAYAIDDEIVWSSGHAVVQNSRLEGGRPEEPDIQDVGAVPYVDEGGREAFRKFLAARKPRAFVVAPDGAWSWRYGGADPLKEALASCNAKHAHCAAYAIDDEVTGLTLDRGKTKP